MDSSTIGALANVASTLIVAIAAFAALRQMRHNNTANELQLHLHFVNELNSPEMRGEIEWTSEFAQRLKDPEYREVLARDPAHPDRRRFAKIMQFFERYASLIIVSGLSEHLILYEYAGMIGVVWDNLYPAMSLIKRRNPYAGRAFEHLAMRARHYEREQLPREYARLLRDPRLVALGKANAEADSLANASRES